MMFKVLLSFAVCGVSALESDTTTRLHHHKHVEAHAHKANAAGIIGAAAVGAAGVGALGTMGSFTSENGMSTSTSSNPLDNLCVLGYTGAALTCSQSDRALTEALCVGGTTTDCAWVHSGVNDVIKRVYKDENMLASNQCFADPAAFTAISGDCKWWSNSKVACDATVDGSGGSTCVYDSHAVSCNQCKSIISDCKDIASQTACELVQTTIGGAAGKCEWKRKTVGGYLWACQSA